MESGRRCAVLHANYWRRSAMCAIRRLEPATGRERVW